MRPCRSCGRPFEPVEHWHHTCPRCYWDKSDPRRRPSPPPDPEPEVVFVALGALDEATLRDAVKLCHPDHQPPERYELATRTTTKLLDALHESREVA